MTDQLALLNAIVNRPEILRMVAPGCDSVDMAPFFTNPLNLLVGNERGAIVFVHLGEGFYSCHILLTESLRGADALTCLRMAFTSLFTVRNCIAITGLIPRENRASRAMVRALGCRPIGSTTDATGRASISYIMERGTWATLLADSSGASDPCLAASPPRATP